MTNETKRPALERRAEVMLGSLPRWEEDDDCPWCSVEHATVGQGHAWNCPMRLLSIHRYLERYSDHEGTAAGACTTEQLQSMLEAWDSERWHRQLDRDLWSIGAELDGRCDR